MTREGEFILRVSLPEQNGTLLHTALGLTNKLLLSASVFWDGKAGKFHNPGTVICCDPERVRALPWLPNVALDSAGYTAHRHWGGVYPWKTLDYVLLAAQLEPAWWAQQDYCCEPAIAPNAEAVRERQINTMWKLLETWAVVDQLRDQHGWSVVQDPIPVLQGWRPDDYLRHAHMMLNYVARQEQDFPYLLGVGSVCQRKVGGPNGILAVLDALDRELPPGIELHFFGCEGPALRDLSQHPRAASTDSMAWDSRASWEAHDDDRKVNIQDRARNLTHWYQVQLSHLRPRRQQPEQARLFEATRA